MCIQIDMWVWKIISKIFIRFAVYVCACICVFMVKNKNELINFFLFLLLLACSLDVYVYIKNSLKRSLLLPLMHTLIQYMRMEMSWDVMSVSFSKKCLLITSWIIYVNFILSSLYLHRRVFMRLHWREREDNKSQHLILAHKKHTAFRQW